MLRVTHAEVNLAAICHNVRAARELAPGMKVLVAVKAQAYGHGAVSVARRLADEHLADWFGVATVSEGIELREAGIDIPILRLSHCFPDELADAIRGLNEDEQIRLVALAWLGRGTYDIDEWSDAVRTARDEHNPRTAEYLMGLPLLGDYLADGLALFGEGIVDDSDTREGVNREDEPLGNMPDKGRD